MPKKRNKKGQYVNCKKIETNCINCNIKIFTIPSRIKEGRGKYCSVYCRNKSKKYRKIISNGRMRDNNPMWNGGTSIYPEKKKARKAEYYQLVYKDYIKKKMAEDPEKYREIRRKSNEKRYSTPEGKINNSISSGIYESIKKIKAGRRWETLVGYTLKELMEHLESKFEPWMNWGNYGAYEEERLKWHIDHIRPKSLFIFISPEDKEFKECWALENLQPLEAIKNIQKSNNYQLFEEDIKEVGR